MSWVAKLVRKFAEIVAKSNSALGLESKVPSIEENLYNWVFRFVLFLLDSSTGRGEKDGGGKQWGWRWPNMPLKCV